MPRDGELLFDPSSHAQDILKLLRQCDNDTRSLNVFNNVIINFSMPLPFNKIWSEKKINNVMTIDHEKKKKKLALSLYNKKKRGHWEMRFKY